MKTDSCILIKFNDCNVNDTIVKMDLETNKRNLLSKIISHDLTVKVNQQRESFNKQLHYAGIGNINEILITLNTYAPLGILTVEILRLVLSFFMNNKSVTDYITVDLPGGQIVIIHKSSYKTLISYLDEHSKNLEDGSKEIIIPSALLALTKKNDR